MPINYNMQDPAMFYQRQNMRRDEKFRHFLNLILKERGRREEFEESTRRWEAEHGLREEKFGLDELKLEETKDYHKILGEYYQSMGAGDRPTDFMKNARAISDANKKPLSWGMNKLLEKIGFVGIVQQL